MKLSSIWPKALSAAALVAAFLATALPGVSQNQPQAQTRNQTTPPAAIAPAAKPQDQGGNQGSIHGQVVFADGSPAAGAKLTLTPAGRPALHSAAEADGSFVFTQVPAGEFTLMAEADNFQPVSTSATLAASDSLTLPTLMLRLPMVVTQVNAISQRQEAELEVRAEESQRILGAIPNFFVSYEPSPVPLAASQKFRLSLRTMVDPINIGVSAAIAGVEQWNDSYPGFGRGPDGYAKRFAANFGDSSIGILLTGAVLPSAFRQDPRYFYKGSGPVRSRIGWVAKQTVEQKGDNGRWQFAWSNLLGDAGAALLSTTYYPPENESRGAVAAENFGLGLASQAIANTLQEFVFGHLTTHHTP